MKRTLCVGIDARFVRDAYPGVGRYVHGLVHGLAELDDVELVLFHGAATGGRLRLDGLRGRAGLRWVELPGRPRSPWDGLRTPPRLRGYGLDVFHSPFPLGPTRCPCPRVVTLHDLIPLRFPDNIRAPWRRPLFRRALGRALASARLVICPSEATRRDLDFYAPRLLGKGRALPKTVVSHEAADPSFRAVDGAGIEAMRRRLGLDGPYVLWVGSWRRHKNVEALLEAWQRLGAERKDCRLVLVGPRSVGPRSVGPRSGKPQSVGPRAVGPREMEDESVLDLGPVDGADLPALYSGAELFVLPSMAEGFGLPAIEAMACGTAVLCSDAGSLPEVVGDAARTFDPRSVDDLTTALRELLADSGLRRGMAERSLEQAARFSWRRTASEHVAAYRQAVES